MLDDNWCQGFEIGKASAIRPDARKYDLALQLRLGVGGYGGYRANPPLPGLSWRSPLWIAGGAMPCYLTTDEAQEWIAADLAAPDTALDPWLGQARLCEGPALHTWLLAAWCCIDEWPPTDWDAHSRTYLMAMDPKLYAKVYGQTEGKA